VIYTLVILISCLLVIVKIIVQPVYIECYISNKNARKTYNITFEVFCSFKPVSFHKIPINHENI
jgi:hypothetical protein